MRQVTQWQWHLDEVFVKINGVQHYLWRAVDHEGEVLERYVTKKRNKDAALKFLIKAMKRYGNPQIIVTDRCPSYGAAMKDIGKRRSPGGRPLSEQQSRKLSPPLQATRVRHAPVSTNAKSAKVRRHTFICVQPF